MLTLANVRVNVAVPGDTPQDICGKPVSIACMNVAQRKWLGSVQERLRSRDWRKLRHRLIGLDIERFEKAAEWLNDAGYIPRDVTSHAGLWDKILVSDPSLPFWTPTDVTPGVVAWLRPQRDVIDWLMKLSEKEFLKAVSRAWEYIEHKQNLRGAGVDAAFSARYDHPMRSWSKSPPRVSLSRATSEFLFDVGAPASLNPELLERFLSGAGRAPSLRALFHWYEGAPEVTIYADTPLEAIGISVHVDRNFSKRRWVECRCGNGFERKRTTDCFCSKKCRNNFVTKARRQKIKLAEQGHEAWKLLPAKKRKGRNCWAWIAEWVKRKSQIDLDPTWVRQAMSAPASHTRSRFHRYRRHRCRSISLINNP